MKNIFITFTFSTLLLLGADKSKTWTDPELALKENTDFSIQGEYHRKGASVGAQVVALGGGKFDLYVLEGGLPGLGWEKKDSPAISKKEQSLSPKKKECPLSSKRKL
jgi:hypothetical protein